MERRAFIWNSSLTVVGVNAFGLADSNSKDSSKSASLTVNEYRIESRMEFKKTAHMTNGTNVCYIPCFRWTRSQEPVKVLSVLIGVCL